VGAGGERPPATRFGSADSNKMIIFLTPSFSVKNERAVAQMMNLLK
jgi:hypothetical protein